LAQLTKLPKTLGQRVSRGQLVVTVHDAASVQGGDGKINAYVVGRLAGAKKGGHRLRTKTAKKNEESNDSPDFSDEKLRFNIIDIAKLKEGAARENGDESTRVMLTVEVYDDNYLKDALLQTVSIDVSELLTRPTIPLKSSFQFPNGGGSISLSITFMAAFAGIVKVTLIEGRNLANMGGLADTQDPYVKLSLPHGNKEQVSERTFFLLEESSDEGREIEMATNQLSLSVVLYKNAHSQSRVSLGIYAGSKGQDDLERRRERQFRPGDAQRMVR